LLFVVAAVWRIKMYIKTLYRLKLWRQDICYRGIAMNGHCSTVLKGDPLRHLFAAVAYKYKLF